MSFDPSPPLFILAEEDALVPVKVDVSYKGARFVDSFCWNCSNPRNSVSVYEFACKTCEDSGLPDGFQLKMALQIQEQVHAYRMLLEAVRCNGGLIQSVFGEVQRQQQRQSLNMSLGIRCQTVDYSDKLDLCVFGGANSYSPEQIAHVTVADLGLPGSMEPVIAHNIRENVYKWLLGLIERDLMANQVSLTGAFAKLFSESSSTPAVDACSSSDKRAPSEISVTVVSPNHAVDMITNLWKRAKPSNFDDQASAPQPKVPIVTSSNATAWNRFATI